MPRALPFATQREVLGLLSLDIQQNEVAGRTGVSERQVQRIKHNVVHYGSTTRPKLERQGRPSKITEEIEDVQSITMIQADKLYPEPFRIPYRSSGCKS
jgi:transposase